MPSPFDRQIARQLQIGGFGDVVGAEDFRTFQPADRRDDDDRAVLALDHAWRGHVDQPVIGEHVVVENLAELGVRDAGHRAVVRIGSRIADQNVDPAEGARGLVDEMLKLLLGRDVGGDRLRRVALERAIDGGRGLGAGLGLARRDDDARAMPGEPLGDGAADAPRRSGDDGDAPGQVEQTDQVHLPHQSRHWYSKPIPNLAKSSKAETKRSKDDQRKRLGFSWISLSESGLFNRLRGPPSHFFF